VVVTVCSALVVEIFGGAGSGDGSEGPDEPHGGESVIFHMSSADPDAAPEALVMGYGSGECLEPSGVRETAAVIADFG
jgi:hypothetical protein